MRVALLAHGGGATPGALARALEQAGVTAEIVAPRGLPDLPMRLRKIGDAPGRLPGTLSALLRGRYDVAHAFTAQDAVAGAAWSCLGRGAAVFSPLEPLSRASIADRRLRLTMLRIAVERSDAVVAHDEAIARSLDRWMSVTAGLLGADDASAHIRLYRELLRR
jgi:hypothetical protein